MKTYIKYISVAGIVIVLFSGILNSFTFAQETWIYYFDPPQGMARTVQQTADGGYIVGGEINSAGKKFDMWLIKLSANGSFEWQKMYGGPMYERTYSIKQTVDGGYIATASIDDTYGLYGDIWVVKLDSNGNIEWQKSYGGSAVDYPYAVLQTADGGYIVEGYTESFGAGGRDAWIIKLNPKGYIQWEKAYGGTSHEGAFDIQQTNDGGYIVAGHTRSFGQIAYPDYWILKLNSFGDIIWQKSYGGSDAEYAHSIKQTPDGGYIVGGYTSSFGPGLTNVWVLRLDALGNIIWQRAYYFSGQYNYGLSIALSDDGGYVVAGGTYDSTGNGDILVFKVNSSGILQWQKGYDIGSTSDFASALEKTSDSGYVISGLFRQDGLDNPVVIKMDSNGNVDSTCGYSTNLLSEASNATVTITAAAGQSSQAVVQNTHWAAINTDVPEINICGETSCIKPTVITNNSVNDPDVCAETGIQISWAVDVGYWGDEGNGERTYDVLRDNVPIATNLPYGTSSIIDNTGTTCNTYLYTVRYNNGCGSSSATEGVFGNDSGHAPCGLINNIAADLDSCADTGVYISWALDPFDWGDGSSGIQTYDVLRDGEEIAMGLGYGNFNYIDSGGTNGTNYNYAIRYNNGCGFSSETIPGANASDSADLEPCPSVGNELFLLKSGDNVLLTWTDIDCLDFANYRIFGGQSFSDPFPEGWTEIGNPVITSFLDALDSPFIIYKAVSLDSCGNLSP